MMDPPDGSDGSPRRSTGASIGGAVPDASPADPGAPPAVHRHVHQLVHEYVAAARQEQLQHRAALEALRARPRFQRRHWITVLVVLLLAVAGGVVLLLQPEDEAARVAAAVARAGCVARQAEVMRAVIHYRRDHAAPPPTLGALRPAYLAVDPVDPETGEAYVYTLYGDVAAVSCPRHRGAGDVGAPLPAPLPQKSYAANPE